MGLHVGGSFTDVSTASPFHRFVETLLHYSVTGGCGGTNYCPASSTTRDADGRVRAGREGRIGIRPARLRRTPVFNDVPASNPFCRFIEELARRGVVGGCGDGNYCPTFPVTREQMGVFVLRTLDPTLNPSACSPPNLYLDVPEAEPVLPLDRGADQPRRGQRLRRRQLLPGRPGHPRAWASS